MDRAIPVSNKLLQQKQKEREDELLYRRLKKIQNGRSEYWFRESVPKMPGHTGKRKQSHGAEIRHKEVQRENAILAQKIREAEKRASATGSSSLTQCCRCDQRRGRGST